MKSSLSSHEVRTLLHEKIVEWSRQFQIRNLELTTTQFFEEIVEHFGPCLGRARVDLRAIFQASFHAPSGSLIVASRGVTLLCNSPFSSIPYITRHIACSVYKPNLGLETVNIGLVGNIYTGEVVLRAESACPPSFLFGSQRCNCHYQWASIRELAAHFNCITPPREIAGEELERWVEKQFVEEAGKQRALQPGRGFILMHLDSQAGMGAGYTEGEFVWDLYNRALMRQLGENRVEQVHHTSIREGYEAIGVYPDSRKEAAEAGYQIPSILLDWLGVSRSLIVLSNNPFKLKQLKEHGFDVKRVKSLGKIDAEGRREAKQRGKDFEHLDMDGKEVSFDEELKRLKECLAHSFNHK